MEEVDMAQVARPSYMADLMRWRDRNVIKVVSGVRRCGKSTLLGLFRDELIRSGVDADSILTLNFEDLRWEHLREYHALFDYVEERLADNAMTYVLLDEVQSVPEFERAVDSLYLRDNVDIYLTGSNAYFMSTELSTVLTGRYVEIPMLPLSFREYCAALAVNTTSSAALGEAYRTYVSDGSFPYLLSLADDAAARGDYLQAIYQSVLLKDVVARHGISDVAMLEDVTRFLLDNIGNILSTTRVAGTMTSAGRPVNQRTVEKYVSALRHSLLFYEARRFDIKGKRLLERLEKYYVVDMGLRQTLLGGRGYDVGRVLENVVYLELIRRGYEVFVGQVPAREVDFVATRADERMYVQVAATVRDPDVLARELGSLQRLGDSYPKLVLTLDDDPDADYDGIRRKNALQWLLAE